jgi:general secretion pathway protein F
MTAFAYKAVTQAGKIRSGVIEAENAQQARLHLRAQSLLPTHLSQRAAQSGKAKQARLGAKPLALLTRQIATLTANGVRIDTGLQTIAQQRGTRGVSEIASALRAQVLEGAALSVALGQFPRTFDAFYRASIKAGEDAGRLSLVANHLADHLDQRAKNAKAIQLALIYPVLLVLVSLAIIAGLLVYVVPDIVQSFAARGAELPWLTDALIGLSAGAQSYGIFVLLAALGLALGAHQVMRLPRARLGLHHALLRLPGVRGICKQVASVQFCSTLGVLLESGVTLADALTSATATVSNAALRARLGAATQKVREGAPLSTALAQTELFSPMLIVMVASGEQSGTLSQNIARSAADQSGELSATVAALVGLAEPLILLIMGGVVMLLVMAILLPIINLNTIVG